LNNGQEKIIKDPKIIYLIKTLSRTKRKDYENYVVNSIWNKLNNDEIEVITQQYIFNPKDDRKHYFIDLYFPSINVGIECDEAHHLNEENKKSDKIREVSIFDALYQINNIGYIAKHIDVTKSYNDIKAQIDEAVAFIKQKINELKPPKWQILEAENYYKEKKIITITDRIGFNTIDETCNILFSTNYQGSGGARQSYFSPNTFRGSKYEGYKVWFPKLAIMDENGKLIAATDSGWNNQLINNGKEFIEKNDKKEIGNAGNIKRIIFAKYKDPLGSNKYKFIGIFEPSKFDGQNRYYKRIEEELKLL